MATFKFLPTDTPPQQVFSDIQALNNFTQDNQLKEFMLVAVSFLSLKEDSQASLEEFSNTYQLSSKVTSNIMQTLLYFLSECLKLSLHAEDVLADLLAFGVEESIAKSIAKMYKKAYATVSGSIIDNTFKVNQLLNIEWKFGVTASNSEVSNVGTCFLQLHLTLDKGGVEQHHVFEMSVSQFYDFLASMQRAATEIQNA